MADIIECLHTNGYPRSGNTWVGKLLADSIGGRWLPSKEGPPLEVFNRKDVNSSYWKFLKPNMIVTKNHSIDKLDGVVVFIYRDPRDVAVSAWHYREKRTPLWRVIESMAKVYDPKNDLYGPYEIFVRTWWDRATAKVSYEELHRTPIESISRILRSVGLESVVDNKDWQSHVADSVKRQSFSAVKSSNPRYFAHSMRNGVVGDWKNHYNERCVELTEKYFGRLMKDQGYLW